jgi:hypothetical protein
MCAYIRNCGEQQQILTCHLSFDRGQYTSQAHSNAAQCQLDLTLRRPPGGYLSHHELVRRTRRWRALSRVSSETWCAL